MGETDKLLAELQEWSRHAHKKLTKIPKNELLVMKSFATGYTTDQIAQLCNVPKNEVTSILNKRKNKIESAMIVVAYELEREAHRLYSIGKFEEAFSFFQKSADVYHKLWEKSSLKCFHFQEARCLGLASMALNASRAFRDEKFQDEDKNLMRHAIAELEVVETADTLHDAAKLCVTLGNAHKAIDLLQRAVRKVESEERKGPADYTVAAFASQHLAYFLGDAEWWKKADKFNLLASQEYGKIRMFGLEEEKKARAHLMRTYSTQNIREKISLLDKAGAIFEKAANLSKPDPTSSWFASLSLYCKAWSLVHQSYCEEVIENKKFKMKEAIKLFESSFSKHPSSRISWGCVDLFSAYLNLLEALQIHKPDDFAAVLLSKEFANKGLSDLEFSLQTFLQTASIFTKSIKRMIKALEAALEENGDYTKAIEDILKTIEFKAYRETPVP